MSPGKDKCASISRKIKKLMANESVINLQSARGEYLSNIERMTTFYRPSDIIHSVCTGNIRPLKYLASYDLLKQLIVKHDLFYCALQNNHFHIVDYFIEVGVVPTDDIFRAENCGSHMSIFARYFKNILHWWDHKLIDLFQKAIILDSPLYAHLKDTVEIKRLLESEILTHFVIISPRIIEDLISYPMCNYDYTEKIDHILKMAIHCTNYILCHVAPSKIKLFCNYMIAHGYVYGFRILQLAVMSEDISLVTEICTTLRVRGIEIARERISYLHYLAYQLKETSIGLFLEKHFDFSPEYSLNSTL